MPTSIRDVNATVATILDGQAVDAGVFVRSDFDSGTLRLWGGYGEIEWDGETWQGGGTLVGITQVEETTAVEATGTRFVVSGVPSEILDLADNEPYQGRRIRAWIVFFAQVDGRHTAQGSVPIFDGLMDVMESSEDGETCDIVLTAENRFIDLTRPRKRLCTPDDQKRDYPDDTFFDYVADLQDLEIVLE